MIASIALNSASNRLARAERCRELFLGLKGPVILLQNGQENERGVRG